MPYIRLHKDSIEAKIRKEKYTRQQIRQQEDRLKGLSMTKGAQRGDFKLSRMVDKTLEDYRRFKDPKDREKIKAEYYGLQKETRKYG